MFATQSAQKPRHAFNPSSFALLQDPPYNACARKSLDLQSPRNTIKELPLIAKKNINVGLYDPLSGNRMKFEILHDSFSSSEGEGFESCGEHSESNGSYTRPP